MNWKEVLPIKRNLGRNLTLPGVTGRKRGKNFPAKTKLERARQSRDVCWRVLKHSDWNNGIGIPNFFTKFWLLADFGYSKYLIVPFWYASVVKQARLVSPWVFCLDCVSPNYEPWLDQTRLICRRSDRAKKQKKEKINSARGKKGEERREKTLIFF